jgi:hypothetical protein
MKSFIAALVAVVALTGSAFAGHCGVQQVQVQRVVVNDHHHAQNVVEFVEVPQLVVVRQQQVHAPVRVVQRVEVQRVQKVVVQNNNRRNNNNAQIRVEINQGRGRGRGRGR